jgi:ubiquinone/menaquinone biosynthesis C-methylase UbiE
MEPIIRRMRDDWDHRAALNAEHFIVSTQDMWARDDFLTSGEQDVQRYLLPEVAGHGLDPAHCDALDFGCGVGRLSRAMARHFRAVTAVDISAEMLQKARQTFGDVNNIRWLEYDGYDLSGIATHSHDVVFSYLVLQHVPRQSLALHYVGELCRVLRPGGLLRVQFSSRALYRLRLLYCNARAWLARRDRLFGWLFRGGRGSYARDELTDMLTLMQHSLPLKTVTGVITRQGLTVVDVDTRDPGYTWVSAVRPSR